MPGRKTFTVLLGLSLALPAFGQATRETALAALRTAAQAGRVDAQLSLGQLLDADPGQRNQEALSWYEQAARAGNRVAQQRYLAMMARPAPPEPPTPSAQAPSAQAASPRSFFIRVPRDFDPDGSPPDIPPGYHCHLMGGGRMWCHGGLD